MANNHYVRAPEGNKVSTTVTINRSPIARAQVYGICAVKEAEKVVHSKKL